MIDILVIAPHPDDESLGCGGTLLKHLDCGDRVHWLIITGMDSPRFSEDEINIRSKEIKKVNEMYGFSSITEFNYPPAKLDQVETSKIIEDLNHCIKQIKPNTIYTVLIDVLDIRDDNMGATITISAEEPSPTEAPTLSWLVVSFLFSSLSLGPKIIWL